MCYFHTGLRINTNETIAERCTTNFTVARSDREVFYSTQPSSFIRWVNVYKDPSDPFAYDGVDISVSLGKIAGKM